MKKSNKPRQMQKRVKHGIMTATAKIPTTLGQEIREYCCGRFTSAHIYAECIKLGFQQLKAKGEDI